MNNENKTLSRNMKRRRERIVNMDVGVKTLFKKN